MNVSRLGANRGAACHRVIARDSRPRRLRCSTHQASAKLGTVLAEDLISRREAAELLGRSISWVRKLETSGQLHPVQGADGRWLHRRHELLAFVAARDGHAGVYQDHAPGMYQDPAPRHVQGYMGERAEPDACTVWQQDRINATLANLAHGLAASGWSPSAIEHARGAAAQALAGLSDLELHGPAWPEWIAASVSSIVLDTAVAIPWMHTEVVDEHGQRQLVPLRPIQPGD